MGWLIVEVLAALAVVVLVVWWTMFSGRQDTDADADLGADDERGEAAPRQDPPAR